MHKMRRLLQCGISRISWFTYWLKLLRRWGRQQRCLPRAVHTLAPPLRPSSLLPILRISQCSTQINLFLIKSSTNIWSFTHFVVFGCNLFACMVVDSLHESAETALSGDKCVAGSDRATQQVGWYVSMNINEQHRLRSRYGCSSVLQRQVLPIRRPTASARVAEWWKMHRFDRALLVVSLISPCDWTMDERAECREAAATLCQHIL